MTLAELGAQLREERSAQGLMVEDVASSLKVPTRILRAIEDGNINDLPHTVYTRGFIKGYGQLVGYPAEKITGLLDSLEGFAEDFSPPKMPDSTLLSEAAGSPSKKSRGAHVLILVLLLVAGGAAFYYYSITHPSGDTDSSDTQATQPLHENPELVPMLGPMADPQDIETMPDSSEISIDDTPISDAIPENITEPEVILSTPELAQPETVAESQPETVPQIVFESAVDAGPEIAVEIEVATSLAPEQEHVSLVESSRDEFRTQSISQSRALPDGLHQIVLTADAECWVHANADGTVNREFSLQIGETFAMPFKTSLVLKLGNAGGVRIKYDGMDMPSAGASGQVRTITLPPQD